MTALLNRELQRFGRVMVVWRVHLVLLYGAGAVCAATALLGLIDVTLQAGRGGRWLGFMFVAGMCAVAVALALRILRQHNTPEGVAAALERTYPELDNRLINFIQFARAGASDAFKAAYVREGVPSLSRLDPGRIRNRRALRQGGIACAVGVLLLLGPFLFLGPAWGRALWRSVNPASALQPVTLTRILAVEPGDIDMPQGEGCLLVCRVEGARGHTVRVEVEPDDARRTTYDLGRIETREPVAFSHRVPRVNTRFRYRFRAGDAMPSVWYTVTPRPPPTLTALEARVEPPAYTRLPRRAFDLRDEAPPVVPAGAAVRLRAAGSATLETLVVSVPGSDPVPMQLDSDSGVWTADVAVGGPGAIRIEGRDRYGQTLHEAAAIVFRPDHPPAIEVTEPQGRIVLPPGESPRIEFQITDDYGLSEVRLERVRGSGAAEQTEVLERWAPDGQAAFRHPWRGEPSAREAAMAYRIVAIDNAPDAPQVTRSATIVFNMPTAERQAELRDRLEEQALTGLQQVIDLQERNIEHSQALREVAGDSEALWREPAARQREIRSLTRDLLGNPIRPLGGRTEAVAALYANEMLLAIDAIARIAVEPAAERSRWIEQGIAIQSAILRQLRGAQAAAGKAQIDRRQSGIGALLSALIEGQADVLRQVEAVDAAGQAPLPLVDRQDALSEDVGVFEAACGREADAVRGNDAAFAGLLETLAAESRERRIRQDMLMAAERLEDARLADALPLGSRAHANLLHLQDLLEQVGMQREQAERVVMAEALGRAQEKLERLEAIHAAMNEAMDAIRGAVDKDTEAFDVLMEEFVELMRKNRETMLTIPVDLHVFTDLNVGNELVEDVFSIFQEVEQVAGSDQQAAEEVMDVAFAKNLEALELMREMQDHFDDMEMWLTDKPETDRVLTEGLDREEMPEAGVALGALAAQLEDLIGDLKEQADEARDAAHDGASTHAVPDMEMGWDVLEGDIVSFAAKGKSGNEVPDHKEQDGRGNIGRQGMATGEAAAGSGTVGEGDNEIEARRTEDPTQSGQVQLDGEADTEATGGGKLASGKADALGMEGGVRRMDAAEEGSWEGMEALMARQADAVFAQASLKNVRAASLQEASRHLRQADDAIAKGDIRRLQEHRQMALAALRQAQAELAAPPTGAMALDTAPSIIETAVQAGADTAPPKYQSQVADYYKLLNETF